MRDSALAKRETIGPHDLSGVDFVAYISENRARQRFDMILSEAGAPPPRVVVETIYAATVCALVGQGVRVGLVSLCAIAGHDQSQLVLRPFEPPVQSRSFLILPPERPKSRLVRGFIDSDGSALKP